MKHTAITLSMAAVAAAALVGCAGGSNSNGLPTSAQLDRMATEVAKASFREQGPVKLDRLQQDETNRECSEAQVAGKPLDEARAKAIEAVNLKTIKWPGEGKFLGDWKRGEAIAAERPRPDLVRRCQGQARRQLLQLPPDHQGGNFLRHDRPEPVPLWQAARRGRSEQYSRQAGRRIHLGQDLERQGLQCLLQHAARRARRHPERAGSEGHHGPPAGPALPSQPVTPGAANGRNPTQP